MTSKRNFGLDLLRAGAIAGVFIAHEVTLSGIPALGAFLGSGVELFFVLSGFLIGRIYFRSSIQPEFSPWFFWRSRWLRTIPPYFAALGLYYLADRALLQPPQPALPWYYCLFLQNYLGMTGFGPSWSLCVEEHFYLLLPLLVFVVDRFLGRKTLYYLLPIMFFVPTLFRVIFLQIMHLSPPAWFFMTHFHCDELIAGLWIAYLFVEYPATFARLRRPAIWVCPLIPIVCLVAPLFRGRPAFELGIYWDTLFGIGFCAWLRGAYDLRWQPSKRAARLVRQGVQGLALCSYSIYLTHTTIDVLIRSWLANWHRGVVKTGLVMLVTFAVGVLFYFLFERSAILIRDRVETYHRSKQRTIEPAASTA
jgi:peptidoglycan/LPS O-acetylase OafA/YrhL